jgi:hypothetical protein
VSFGGPGVGWFPIGAEPPLAEIEIAFVELHIRQTSNGYFLESTSSNQHFNGDTWHQSYEQAVAQAQTQFGVTSNAWADVAA